MTVEVRNTRGVERVRIVACWELVEGMIVVREMAEKN